MPTTSRAQADTAGVGILGPGAFDSPKREQDALSPLTMSPSSIGAGETPIRAPSSRALIPSVAKSSSKGHHYWRPNRREARNPCHRWVSVLKGASCRRPILPYPIKQCDQKMRQSLLNHQCMTSMSMTLSLDALALVVALAVTSGEAASEGSLILQEPSTAGFFSDARSPLSSPIMPSYQPSSSSKTHTASLGGMSSSVDIPQATSRDLHVSWNARQAILRKAQDLISPRRKVLHWPASSLRFVFLEETLKNCLTRITNIFRAAGVTVTTPYRAKKDPDSCMLLEEGPELALAAAVAHYVES